MWAALVLIFIAGCVLGASVMSLIYARDPSIAKLADDEVITKAPDSGKVLVQVTPEVMRRLYNAPETFYAEGEARRMYRGNLKKEVEQ